MKSMKNMKSNQRQNLMEQTLHGARRQESQPNENFLEGKR